MYYTALPSNSCKFGTRIWNNGRYEVYDFQGRYELVVKDYSVAQLINGEQSLKKYYKNNFFLWIDKVKTKDLKKAEKIKTQAKLAIIDANFIIKLWKN